MTKQNNRLFFKPEDKKLYEVAIYNGKSLLGTVTVTAGSPEDASNVAIQDINVKIKRAYN